jgi:hypothetical protein
MQNAKYLPLANFPGGKYKGFTYGICWSQIQRIYLWQKQLEMNTKDLPMAFLEGNTKEMPMAIFLEANTKDLPMAFFGGKYKGFAYGNVFGGEYKGFAYGIFLEANTKELPMAKKWR